MLSKKAPLLVLIFAAPVMHLSAQEQPSSQATMGEILQRLDTLEKENRELMQEVHALRQQLNPSVSAASPAQTAATPPEKSTLDERVQVNERRIEEQAQTKVESSSKFPVQLNGMLLFNAFANSATEPGETPANYGLLSGPDRSGATVRQTLLGFQFQGPKLPGDGRVTGSVMMDFWAGPSQPGDSWLRLRRADVTLEWAHRSFSVGQDKPLISPYQPDSLAEVGVPPLAGSGNLWLWLPQARYEERVRLGQSTGLNLQVSAMQTDDSRIQAPTPVTNLVDKARPSVEERVAFWHKFDDTRRFELGSGFHASTSHIAGQSVPSRIATVDWLFAAGRHLEIKGTFYHGQNAAGLGSLGNAFGTITAGSLNPVTSTGGWTQFAFPITNRLTFNLFGGLEDDRSLSLSEYATVRNFTYASNVMYRVGPNVVVSLEALQSRTRLFSGTNELHNSYDLAIGYLF